MATPTTKHPDIAAMADVWRDIDNVIAGQREVKKLTTTYLPRLPGQRLFTVPGVGTVDPYASYLMRAVLLPFAKPLLNRMVGMVVRRPPQLSLPATIEEYTANWTLNGQSFEAFAKLVLRENASKGFGSIVVDWSDVYNRPFHRLYLASTILDFDEADLGGRKVATSVTLTEPYWITTKSGAKLRLEQERKLSLVENFAIPEGVPTPDNTQAIQTSLQAAAPTKDEFPFGYLRQEVRRQELNDNGDPTQNWRVVEVKFPTRRGRPLGFLTCVPFNPFGATWEVCEAPMLDLIELILADYLVSADYHELGHKVGAGTLLHGSGFSDEDQKKLGTVGGGSVILTAGDSKLEYVQTTGTDSVVLRNQRDDLRQQMVTAVGRLLASQQKNVAESAASQEIQFSSEDANLQNIAGSTAIALEEATKIAAWWTSTAESLDDVENVSVELNDQFLTMQISTDDITTLGLEVDQHRFSVEDYAYEVFVRGQRGRPGRSFEEIVAELKRLQAEGMALDEAARQVDTGGVETPPADPVDMQDQNMRGAA